MAAAEQTAAGKQQTPLTISQVTAQQGSMMPNYVISVEDPNAAPAQETPAREVQATDQQEGSAEMSKDLFVERKPAAAAARAGGTSVRVGTRCGSRPVSASGVRQTTRKLLRKAAPRPFSSITVVNSLPSEQLFADIILNHQ